MQKHAAKKTEKTSPEQGMEEWEKDKSVVVERREVKGEEKRRRSESPEEFLTYA